MDSVGLYNTAKGSGADRTLRRVGKSPFGRRLTSSADMDLFYGKCWN